MALSWNEIRTRATAFVHEWKDETSEHAEAKSFWDDFFNVFGVHRRRVASFESAVKKAGGDQGFIDLFWPGVMLAEHKSRGKDLGKARAQALDYFPGLTDEQLPRYIVVSDFARFRLYDLDEDDACEFKLEDFAEHIEKFGFIAGYEKREYHEQNPVNVKAAEKMGLLHDSLYEAGYKGHDLEVFLVRLLFCLFADDTGIFMPREAFQDILELRTHQDGSDLGARLSTIFEVLNTPDDERQAHLDEQFAALPYVNGKLFAERLRTVHFDSKLREVLLDAGRLDWGAISPAIFGAMFQGAMDTEKRRHLGAHYTSEKDILKVIGPLFLDELRAEFERVRKNDTQLRDFHKRLAAVRLLDPACGCGNFLVVAYRELRLLEIEVISALQHGQQVVSVHDLVLVNVDQCFGIEIEEFPAQIAQVAIWLVDHQMNVEVAKTFGLYFTRLPLRRSAQIVNGNALVLDWQTCFDEHQPDSFDYILGNPPFVGKQYQTAAQKKALKAVMKGIQGSGVLDFVTGWYIRAAQYMKDHPETVTAFVSTNSISQGEQVGVLWAPLFETYGAKIHFAHRTFQWTSEAAGTAAVHVVIIGWALFDTTGKKALFEYKDIQGEAHEQRVSNINPYLVDASDVAVLRRRTPLNNAPDMVYGSKPTDGGNLLLSPKEKSELLQKEPEAAAFIKPLIGSKEFINNIPRFCLWLRDAQPKQLRKMPEVMKRIEAVREMRLSSTKKATNKMADYPTLFAEDRHHNQDYLAVPEVSSINRDYIPIGYVSKDVIATNKIYTVPNATLYEFGVLSSTMHMAWTRYTAGRLKSDYQYSTGIVFNNFPWPEKPSPKNISRVESTAQSVLDAREPFLNSGSTLADLYDPAVMPAPLVKAHHALDRAVDLAYRPQAFTTEINRVSFLFGRYNELINADQLIPAS